MTKDPVTKEFMIIMKYYKSDLKRYLDNEFYNLDWKSKLSTLSNIIRGLEDIHNTETIHRDLHSGNILNGRYYTIICDLGLNKSSTIPTEIYGVIPYVAPEIFQGKKYTMASDIYSFGMIMWEFMTGRRPFWDKVHDMELIIEICDGLRPPIVINAPEGYIKLMQECWDPDPLKRPTAAEINKRFDEIHHLEYYNSTFIIKSSDIGPIMENHPGAIYSSRFLSDMINSAMTKRNLRSETIDLELGKYF